MSPETSRNPIVAATAALALLATGVVAGAETPAMSGLPANVPRYVGNGVHPVINSGCSPHDQSSLVPVEFHGHALSAPRVVSVAWPALPDRAPVDPAITALTGDYVTDLFTAPSWDRVMPQYLGMTPRAFEGHFDLPSLITLSPVDGVESGEIAREISEQIAAGALPPADPGGESIYLVHMPPGVVIDYSGIGRSCEHWCAYHDYYSQLEVEPYELFTLIVMPDYSDPASGCVQPQPSGGYKCAAGDSWRDAYFSTISHEMYETVTDPYGSGWINDCPHRGGEEVGDLCSAYHYYAPRRTFGAGAPQCPNRWTIQAAFSNEDWFASQDVGEIDACVVVDAIEEETPCVDTSACGDGAIDFGEDCDAGELNGTPASCCSDACTYLAADESCEDGNACTLDDTCDGAGACRPGPDVVCQPLDPCHDAGTCNPATGECTDPAKPDGTSCEDGDACTGGDTCQQGACAGGGIVEVITDPPQLLECIEGNVPLSPLLSR